MTTPAKAVLDSCTHLAHARGVVCCGLCGGICGPCTMEAIRAAVEEEREACARIPETWEGRCIPSPIAAAIRARGGK